MTDYQGSPATEFLGGQAFGDTDNDGFLEIIDAYGFPISFAIEMYDDAGTLIVDPTDTTRPWQLDPAFDNTFNDQPLLDGAGNPLYDIGRSPTVNNLRFRLVSSLSGEIISN